MEIDQINKSAQALIDNVGETADNVVLASYINLASKFVVHQSGNFQYYAEQHQKLFLQLCASFEQLAEMTAKIANDEHTCTLDAIESDDGE